MKLACVLLWLLMFACAAVAQTKPQPALDQVTSREFLKQLLADGVYNFISAGVAESLLTHRVEPVIPHGDMMARVSGTVIVAFEITKDGHVRHAMAVSGPMLLKVPVVAAVKQWTFKPYALGGEMMMVATSIPVAVSNF
jgi:hypothetical protein